LTRWTVITDTLTSNGFTRNAKHGLNSWKWSNLVGTSPVVLQYILLFFHFVVCDCLFVKHLGSHSDVGKLTEYF